MEDLHLQNDLFAGTDEKQPAETPRPELSVPEMEQLAEQNKSEMDSLLDEIDIVLILRSTYLHGNVLIVLHHVSSRPQFVFAPEMSRTLGENLHYAEAFMQDGLLDQIRGLLGVEGGAARHEGGPGRRRHLHHIEFPVDIAEGRCGGVDPHPAHG